jgi:hypothetical protein
MPRYFFHLRDGTDVLLDPEGRTLDGPETLPGLALAEARSLISHDAREGRIRLDQRIEVEDAAGNVVCRVEFADAVEITGGR